MATWTVVTSDGMWLRNIFVQELKISLKMEEIALKAQISENVENALAT